jgi:sialate O-acetylesterase
MRLRNIGVALAVATAGIGSATAARADVTLPFLLSDGMVLQQKAPVRLYGKASPGEKVTVSVQGKTVRATAGKDGAWDVTLKSLAPGGPFTLTIAGKNRLEFKDVLVGEVWVCSGQSNMEMTLGGLPEARADIAAANDPLLRMFTVTKSTAATPQPEILGGQWEKSTSGNVLHFSAVGYYFARALRAALKVPVGMIHTSWGGTRIQAWTSKETLLANGVPARSAFPAPGRRRAFRNWRNWTAASGSDAPSTCRPVLTAKRRHSPSAPSTITIRPSSTA